MLTSLLLCPALLSIATQAPSSNAPGASAMGLAPASIAANVALGAYTLTILESPVPGTATALSAQATNGWVVGFSVSIVGGVTGQPLPTVWKNGLLQTLPLPTGAITANAVAVNASGTIVGTAFAATDYRAFVSDGTTTALLRPLVGTASSASDVNDLGVIVGASSDLNGATPHTAVLWTPSGAPIRLGSPLFGDSYARAINDANEIVGEANLVPSVDARPFLWSKGKLRYLPLPPGDFAGIARDINDFGVIVGQSGATKFQSHAVVWTNGAVQTLPIPAGLDYSVAWSINDRGAIVGVAGTASNTARPFLSIDGQFAFFDDLIAPVAGFSFSISAVHIDDDGRIVGNGKLNGKARAYALTPP